MLKTWLRLYEEGERVLGAPFFVQKKGLQEKGLKAAGFTEITSVDYKVGSSRVEGSGFRG